VSDGVAMEEFAEHVRTVYGIPDVVVNNAGIAMAGPFLAHRADDWERLLAVNLWGVIHGARLFGAQLAERAEGGHIVNVASAAAFVPQRSLPAYSTSKAAVLMLSECLRADLAGTGVGVSAICPGFIHTNLTRTTRFVGRSSQEQLRLRGQISKLYRLRGYAPERVADRVIAAVVRNQAVAPVSTEAHLLRWLSRLTPEGARQLARMNPLPR
jgi:NAD(P)-dependent dehydrogenase (short-subunit alcohol dehydrogenase family)